MKIISIVNQKGGVAKTTRTRNVAYILSKKFGKRVLLIDMDDSGNLSESFHCLLPEKTTSADANAGVSRLLTDSDCKPEDVIVQTNYDGIDIIPCNSALAQVKVQIETDVIAMMQFRLKNKLKALRKSGAYDFCIIDTKAGLDALVVNALCASDEVIIPTMVDKDSLNMVQQALKAIEQVSDYSEVALRGVLFTMVNTRTSMDRQAITVFAKNVQYPVFDTYIRHSAAVKQARWGYRMCDEDNPGSPSALDYDNFVCELLGVERLHKNGASRKGFAISYAEQQAKRNAQREQNKARKQK